MIVAVTYDITGNQSQFGHHLDLDMVLDSRSLWKQRTSWGHLIRMLRGPLYPPPIRPLRSITICMEMVRQPEPPLFVLETRPNISQVRSRHRVLSSFPISSHLCLGKHHMLR